MKKICWISLLALTLGCGETPSSVTDSDGRQPPSEPAFTLSSTVLDNSAIPFLRHTARRPFGSYLTMNITYPPVAELRDQVVERRQLALRHRGEAHITVITPPEHDAALKDFVSIERIHDIALNHNIQDSSFEVVCLGKGEKEGRQLLQTFFVVVRSPELVAIREQVEVEYLAAGGDPEKFSAAVFYPHITLGFTDRDLHLSDGVVKDGSSCDGEIATVD